MKLYDTQSRQLKDVEVIQERIRMYCCGPTVYRDAHVGNLRTFLLSDLIARVVRLNGATPYLIQNITDVGHMSEDFVNDDKMLSQAKMVQKDSMPIGRYGKQLVIALKWCGIHRGVRAFLVGTSNVRPCHYSCSMVMLTFT